MQTIERHPPPAIPEIPMTPLAPASPAAVLAVETVNLGVDRQRARVAQACGLTRWPALPIGGRVMRLPDHSSIAQCAEDSPHHTPNPPRPHKELP